MNAFYGYELSHYSYDTDSLNLYVRFESGARHVYKGVPAEVARRLERSKNKGAYIKQQIRTRYKCEQLA